MSDTKVTPEMVKAAQRASGIGFFTQLLHGPAVDAKPMTNERAGALYKRAHGFFVAKQQRVQRIHDALAKA